MPDLSQPSARPRRVTLAVFAVVTVAVGLTVHRFGSGIQGDVAGDALYAVMVYLVVACVLARTAQIVPATIAVAACTGIELLQLTGLPRGLAEVFPPAALVLGTGFDLRDLIVYAVAVAVAMLVDIAVSRAVTARVHRA